jgi:hypothetical protein
MCFNPKKPFALPTPLKEEAERIKMFSRYVKAHPSEQNKQSLKNWKSYYEWKVFQCKSKINTDKLKKSDNMLRQLSLLEEAGLDSCSPSAAYHLKLRRTTSDWAAPRASTNSPTRGSVAPNHRQSRTPSPGNRHATCLRRGASRCSP